MNNSRTGKSLLASEIDLIERMAAGKSVKAIAAESGRSMQTVSARVKRVMLIAGAKNHFQLGVWARDNGYAESIRFVEVAGTQRGKPEMVSGQLGSTA